MLTVSGMWLRPSSEIFSGWTYCQSSEGQVCPACGANLVLRRGRFGMFIGCSNYPECEHTELIDKPDETAITCPNAGRAIWFSAAPVMAKHFTPVIATRVSICH